VSQLNSGSMRTRVKFQRRLTTTGTRGESQDDWVDLGSRDCEIVFLSGRELTIARQVFARASVQIKLRLPKAFTLTTKDRGVRGGVNYTIGSALPSDEKFDDLVLLCEVEQ
jgi:SPP1 family predicted phage head-tail adaptor